mgnify:FL=1
MELADVLYSCSCITGISSIPARIYINNSLKQSYGLENMIIDPLLPYERILLNNNESVGYCCTPFQQFYGAVRHKEFTMIFGPVGQAEYTQQEKRDYAFILGISPMEFDQILSAMRQIPAFTLENFLHFLLLLNFYFNNERKDICEIAAYPDTDDSITAGSDAIKQAHRRRRKENEAPPSFTRSFEREMLNFVREGDVEGLKKFLSAKIQGNVGILSGNQIRQQKNLFIVATTLISRAAMDGGMYEDEAYELSDMYIRKCEELFSAEAVMKLTYRMALDFTQRVFEIGSQTSLSPLIASVITYIRRNISSDLSCKALSARFFINRNQLSAKFKKETGKTLNEFVMQERISRAQKLLTNTDKSLAEISDYLGFSSQSYFHTVFKRYTGKTPNDYRYNIGHQ